MAGSQPRPPARALARLSALVRGGLAAVVALAPLPFASNRPWAWSLLALAVGGLLVLWALAGRRDRDLTGIPWRLYWPFVALFALVVAWIALQASPGTPAAWHHPIWARAAAALGQPLAGAVSIDPARTLTALMRLLAYAGVFWLAYQMGRSRRHARVMLATLAIAGFAYGVYGLVVQFAGLDSILWYRRWAYPGSLTSSFVNRNAFATYAGLSLLATLGLLVDDLDQRVAGRGFDRAALGTLIENAVGRWGVLAVMALVQGTALLLTQSRGGLVSTAVGVVMLAVLVAARPGRRPLVSAIAVGVFIGLGLTAIALGGAVALERLNFTFIAAEQRPALYRLVAGAILDRPWLGVGYGTFEDAFPLIRDATIEGGLVYDKAHDSYLEFAYEAGVPAFAVMIGLLAALFGLCLRGALKRRGGPIGPAVAAAATVLVGVHALVDFTIQIPAVAVSYALLLGVGCAQAWTRPEVAAVSRIVPPA